MRALFSLTAAAVFLSLSASQPRAAEPFSPTSQPLGYIGPIELSITDLGDGARAYRSWFENSSWQGDLVEYTVTSAGSMATSIDLSGFQPAQGGGENWSANFEFAGKNENYWDQERKIILGTGDGQKAFRWSQLTAEQKQAVDRIAYDEGKTQSVIVNFIRGDRSQEYPDPELEDEPILRQRFSILGDIIRSNPEYVARPFDIYDESSYAAFVNENADRTPVVYVGANDGMLHAFDADDGNELWAYIPSMVVDNLSRLAGIPYSHTYFVDGGITVRDAYFDGEWRSVLAGSLGAGGKGLFLLDVTEPELQSESLNSGDNKKVLWEIDEDNTDVGADLGYIFGESTIARLNDGRWYAINGNGVSSESGIAKLLAVDIESGDVVAISTGAGDGDSPNGLSPPALIDSNFDGRADIAYAGDIDGDLWRFDLSAESPADWEVAYKLYDGDASQPITVAPDVTNHPQSGFLVLFGTGRLYTVEDILDTSQQVILGIRDTGTAPEETNLIQRELSADTAYSGGGATATVRTFETSASIDWSEYNGWQVNLPAGERLLTAPILRAGRLKSTVTRPNGNSNWLLEVRFDEGTYTGQSIFDLDRNGILDEGDQVDNNGNGELGDPEDVPMAWQRQAGAMSQVTVARLEQGFDTLFLNYLNPPLVTEPVIPPLPSPIATPELPGCIGDCDGGLEGGHFDVDVSTIFGDKSTRRKHNYDDLYDTTFIDYIEPEGNLNPAQDSVGERKFVALIANADFSPGGQLQLGNLRYNVLEYQVMLHRRMREWDGTGSLEDWLQDDYGNSLVHTMTSLQAEGGTLRINFGSRSIIGGGLHPTGFRCVRNFRIDNDRFRNGALLMHLVDFDHLSSASNAAELLDKVYVQNPSDMYRVVMLSNGKPFLLKQDFDGNGVIEPGPPDYEVLGGMRAIDGDSGFLYETAVFWHNSEVCYGDPGWERQMVQATGNINEDLYAEMLREAGFESFEELLQGLAARDSCRLELERNGGCQEEYNELAELYELGRLFSNQAIGGGIGEGGLGPETLSTEPPVIDGGIGASGITSGPNFRTGRRTWTDIVPRNVY